MPGASDALRLLREVVGVYSPSGREGKVASTISRWLETHSNFDGVTVDRVGNVVATKGPGPYFLLCGHMDTVPGKLPLSFKDGMVMGRGAVDAKASLAAMCVAASRVARTGVKDVAFAAVVREETDGRGIKEVLSRGYRYVGGAFGEPSGAGIVVGYRGRLGLEFEVQGRAAHASSATLGVNAVEIGMKLALRLKDELAALGYVASVTTVRGGRAENMIPAKCAMAIDVRIPVGMSVKGALRVVHERSHEGTEIKISELTPPINVGRANPVFSAASAALREAGMQPKALIKAGTSDMNVFYLITKAPCVAYGPGDASLSHTDQERVAESEYLTSIGVYSSMTRKVLHL
jgi:LysW-gamma-L-lysine carboxypeptidase